MKLFTADIDKKLFAQYLKGSDLANQVVVAKIFNPYGRGTWYLLNSDPEDPEYLWAIVDLGDIEVGSVNRSDLENIRIKPFMLGLERDLSFTPINAAEIYRGLNSGKTYAKGGVTMAHPKSYYQNLPSYSGYKWVGFDKGKHIFQKKEAKGYSVIEALESDLTNGNIEFMAEHGLTNTNKKAEGGAIYKHKHMDATAKILEKTNKGYKVEFTDNSVRKPKAKIMYFNDIDFDKEKGYFEKMETGGGVGNDIYYGVIDSNNNLVFQSKNEREAKQVSYSYEGSIVKKYSGKGKIHQYAKGGAIGFIPMDLEEDLAITAKWGGTDIKGVIGILNAMIDSGLADEDLKPKPTKTGRAFQKAMENKTKEIWAKIEPQYKGDFKGNMYYSTIKRLVERSGTNDDILKRFKPFRKNQNFAIGGGVGETGNSEKFMEVTEFRDYPYGVKYFDGKTNFGKGFFNKKDFEEFIVELYSKGYRISNHPKFSNLTIEEKNIAQTKERREINKKDKDFYNLQRKFANGGGVGDYKLKDVVDFNYGRADERKVLSGTITDILTDGYTISTGFKQVLVEPKDIIGYTKKEEPKKKRFGIFADGGGVGNEVYIEFLNKDKGFKKDVKHFKSYEEAVKWGRENFDKFNSDMIHYKMATGGGTTKKEFIAKKVEKVMREFKKGDLHSGKSGKIVKNPKQAIAIALSEGKRGWKHKK